jgi:hypothetical protein
MTDIIDFENIKSTVEIEWPEPPNTDSKISKWGEVPPGILPPSDEPV